MPLNIYRPLPLCQSPIGSMKTLHFLLALLLLFLISKILSSLFESRVSADITSSFESRISADETSFFEFHASANGTSFFEFRVSANELIEKIRAKRLEAVEQAPRNVYVRDYTAPEILSRIRENDFPGAVFVAICLKDNVALNVLCPLMFWSRNVGTSETIEAELIRRLVNMIDNVDRIDGSGNSLLHYAAVSGRLDIVEILLNKNCDVNMRNSLGRIPLVLAIQQDHVEIAKTLMSKMDNVDQLDKFHELPLHHAARHGLLDIVKILLPRTSNVHSENMYGLTPIFLAAKFGRSAIVRLIKGWPHQPSDFEYSSPQSV